MKTHSSLTKKGQFEWPFLWICYNCGRRTRGGGLIFIKGHEEAAAALFNLKQKSHFQLFNVMKK